MTQLPPSILATASGITLGARRDFYGHPLDNHALTGALWASYLGLEAPLTPEQVCMLNILQKISRHTTGPGSVDNLVDICGYAANIEQCADERLARARAALLTTDMEP